MRLLISTLLVAWTIFMLTQIVQAISEYGMYSGLLVMLQVTIWYGVAWIPFWILKEMN